MSQPVRSCGAASYRFLFFSSLFQILIFFSSHFEVYNKEGSVLSISSPLIVAKLFKTHSQRCVSIDQNLKKKHFCSRKKICKSFIQTLHSVSWWLWLLYVECIFLTVVPKRVNYTQVQIHCWLVERYFCFALHIFVLSVVLKWSWKANKMQQLTLNLALQPTLCLRVSKSLRPADSTAGIWLVAQRT